MNFGRIRIARIPTARSVPPAGADDLVVLSLTFRQSDGEAATIEIDTIYPLTGLVSGPRWACIYVEVDGIEQGIARGQIVGNPIAFPGEPVTIEIICRRPDHVSQLDGIYAPYDAQVPAALADPTTPRRSEPYVPGMPYIDPITLEASIAWTAGLTGSDRTIYGQTGSESDHRDILAMSMSITDAPVSEVVLEAEAYFVEHRTTSIDVWRKVTNGDGPVVMPSGSSDPAPVQTGSLETMTPEDLRSVIQQPSVDGNGAHVVGGKLQTVLSRTVEVLTSEPRVGPYVGEIVAGSKKRVGIHRITSASILAVVSAEQPRREILTVRMLSDLQDIGGSEVVTEQIALGDVQERVRSINSYTFIKPNGDTVYGYRSEGALRKFWHTEAGVFRETNRDIIEALQYRCAKILIDRAHCVEIALQTTLEAAWGLTGKNRVTVQDVRLQGGSATGRVRSISYTIGSSETAEIVLSCPITNPNTARTGDYAFNFSVNHDGPIAPPPASPAVDAIRSGGQSAANFFVASFAIKGLAPIQELALVGHRVGDQSATAIADVGATIPKTEFEISLTDATPVDLTALGDYRVKMVPGTLALPYGIRIF